MRVCTSVRARVRRHTHSHTHTRLPTVSVYIPPGLSSLGGRYVAGVQGASVAAVAGPRGLQEQSQLLAAVGVRCRKELFYNLLSSKCPPSLFSPVHHAGGIVG